MYRKVENPMPAPVALIMRLSVDFSSPLNKEKKLLWKTKANMMLGNTESTAKPSLGRAIIVKEFCQVLFDIWMKNMMIRNIMARTKAKTPMTDRYFRL